MKARDKKIACEIGDLIAKRRRALSLTQGQIAEKIGVETETISRIERGAVLPPLSRLADIAKVLKCSLNELIKDNSSVDRSASLTKILSDLSDKDSKLLIEVVEKLAIRLKSK